MRPVNSSANIGDIPGDWGARLEKVCQQAADEFRFCSADPLEQLRICARYFQRGKLEGFDHGELIDYLGVSTPSVFDMAGLSETLTAQIMALPPLLKEDEAGVCRAPEKLPPTPPEIPPSIQPDFDWDKPA